MFAGQITPDQCERKLIFVFMYSFYIFVWSEFFSTLALMLILYSELLIFRIQNSFAEDLKVKFSQTKNTMGNNYRK